MIPGTVSGVLFAPGMCMAQEDIRLLNKLTGTAVWIVVLLLGINLIGGKHVNMAKRKITKTNEKIAEAVTDGYKKIETGVVDGYKKLSRESLTAIPKSRKISWRLSLKRTAKRSGKQRTA